MGKFNGSGPNTLSMYNKPAVMTVVVEPGAQNVTINGLLHRKTEIPGLVTEGAKALTPQQIEQFWNQFQGKTMSNQYDTKALSILASLGVKPEHIQANLQVQYGQALKELNRSSTLELK